MEIENIRSLISSTLVTTAGIVGFKSLNKENDVDFENDGIVVSLSKENERIVNISLGLIIMSNINAKGIVEEIYSIINYYLKQKDLILGSLSVYIKGTK